MPPPERWRARPARFCVQCGRALDGMRWVATAPAAVRPRRPAGPRSHYAGPPTYPRNPGWSLWPWVSAPAPGPDGPLPAPPPTDPESRLRADAGLLRNLARTTAILAAVAAVAEGWRYVLLLMSRTHALSPGPLGFSDALVALIGLLAPAAALATGAVFLRWLLLARRIAAGISGTVPSRRSWAVVLGSVLPPATLTVPGAALAEVEHAASGLPADRRPRPSWPVRRWWVAWSVGVVCGLLALLRGASHGTQALADAVVLHGLADALAAVTAVLTVGVVDHLTGLLAPVLRPAGREGVLRVGTPTAATTTAATTAG